LNTATSTPLLPDPKLKANFVHLYADVIGYGILAGSTMAFIAIYAARLGASGFQISLLTAGPAVINLFFSLPAGRWLERRSLTRVSFLTAALHRFGYLILIPLPLLLSNTAQVWIIVLITLLMSIPGTALAIAFNALLADLIPPQERSTVIGRRNALTSLAMTVAALISGQLLDTLIYPINYVILFSLGTLGGIFSTYHLWHLKTSDIHHPRIHQPLGDLARPGMLRFTDSFRLPPGLRFLTRSPNKPLLQWDMLKGSFGPLLTAYLFFYTCQYVPVPISPLYMVNGLKYSDGIISLGNSLFYVMMFITSMRLSHLTRRFNHHKVLAIGSILYCAYPFFISLAWDATLFWAASIFGGIAWALTSAGLINRLMEVVPEDNRPAYMAMHNLALNLGILSGSFLGPVLATIFGLKEALLLAGVLRLLAGLSLRKWG